MRAGFGSRRRGRRQFCGTLLTYTPRTQHETLWGLAKSTNADPATMSSVDDASWRAWFDRSLLPILVVDDQRRYTDANLAACLLLRIPRAQVLTLRIDDLTTPENLPLLERRWQDFMQAGTQAGVHEFLMPDGQRVRGAYSATVNFIPGKHIATIDPQHTGDACRGAANASAEPLSGREREVMALVAIGQTGPAIARDLHISLATVETHIRHCLAKLGAKNRPHAVLLAMRRGEISLL